jgi:2-phospho-L-lactate guanylyltransferase
VVPVKNLAEAKKRLSGHLSHEQRRKLVLAMLHDVLRALNRANLFSQTIVVSPDEYLQKEVARNDAVFVRQNNVGLNAAVRQANMEARRRNFASITTVLADIPLVEARDFEEVHGLNRSKPCVVLSPSLKGGTNVMVRTPPGVIPPAYGRWSYAKHLRVAQGKGLPVYSISNPRLAFDVDTIQDVRLLARLDRDGRTNAGRVALSFHQLS